MTVQASPRKGGIALTGATGYIGRATVQAALSRGYGVVAFGRRPLDVPGVGFQHYDLKDEVLSASRPDASRSCISPQIPTLEAVRISTWK